MSGGEAPRTERGGAAASGALIRKNIIFGMYSGLALLMDMYRPRSSNGLGVVFVGGSGWQASPEADTPGLKDRKNQTGNWIPPLLRSGYTVFVPNHRAAPRFRYPAALDDIRRAVRFIRCHSEEFGIDASRLGAVAGSSGAHLACLCAMTDTSGNPENSDPVLRESASLQCLVLRAAPTDLLKMALEADGEGSGYALAFMDGGGAVTPGDPELYRMASPLSHVSPASPPVLLIHGDRDRTVPYSQSVAMEAAMRAAGAKVGLVTIPGGIHDPDFGADGAPPPDWPDYLGATLSWLDEHLGTHPTRLPQEK